MAAYGIVASAYDFRKGAAFDPLGPAKTKFYWISGAKIQKWALRHVKLIIFSSKSHKYLIPLEI